MKNEFEEVAETFVPEGLEARAEAALRSMEALRDLVDRKVEDVRSSAEWGERVPDLERLMRDLSKAVISAVELEGKVQDAKRIGRGGHGLDLDAARSEIRRRLDLRAAAGGAASVDGGPE